MGHGVTYARRVRVYEIFFLLTMRGTVISIGGKKILKMIIHARIKKFNIIFEQV